MAFASLLKGRLAERIVVTLLERGGFRVTRLGIEELFDEIKYLPKEQYLSLGLPPQLRALPDLLVADPQVSWAAMLEIKFRRRFDEGTAREIHRTLREQRRHWADAWAIVIIAEPFVEGGRFHQDYIRLIGPDDLDKLVEPVPTLPNERERAWMSRRWDRLPMLTKLFYDAHGNDEQSQELAHRFWHGADFVTAAIRELRNL
jgi:hypothetical protein